MSQAPTKVKKEQELKQKKVEKDNLFLDILYNILVQAPALAFAWVISKIEWD